MRITCSGGVPLLSCQACLLHLRGIKGTVTHHGEQNVAAPSCQGDKRLVVSFPLAHFACVVSLRYRISERGEGGQEQCPFEAFIAPSHWVSPGPVVACLLLTLNTPALSL